jgi:plasmid stability protein
MASLTISDLEEPLALRLRDQAETNGRSVEDEARQILEAALGNRSAHTDKPQPRTGQDLVRAFRETFGPLGGVELDLPTRHSGRDLPTFEG